MKIFYKIALLALLSISSSCAMLFGDKTDQVSIGSSPSGADIFIDGINYGRTPATITIEAKNSTVVLTKEGYGSTKLEIEAWATMKNKGCSLDILTAILPWSLYSAQWSGYCNEFKKDSYSAVIPNLSSSNRRAPSMMGVGKKPADMINYYYDQNKARNQHNYYQQQQGTVNYYQNRGRQ